MPRLALPDEGEQQLTRELHWRKAGKSMTAGDCVEMARLTGHRIGVRDSKMGASGPVLALAPVQMRVLLDCIKQGVHDPR